MVRAKRLPAKFLAAGNTKVKPHFITKKVQPSVYNPNNPNQKKGGGFYWNPLLTEQQRQQGIKAIDHQGIKAVEQLPAYHGGIRWNPLLSEEHRRQSIKA